MVRELTFLPEDQIGRRKDRRRNVQLPARMTLDGKSIDGSVADLSESGAKLSLTDAELSGERVVLEVVDHRFDAVIVWRDDGALGLTFADDVPTAIVDALASISGRR